MNYKKPLPDDAQASLDEYFEYLQDVSSEFAGYPCNKSYDYSELYKFLSFSLNNIGDPFHETNYKVNSHKFECEVLTFFAKLFKAENDFRGYVSNGGTEGNLFGIDLGKQKFPEAIIYFSDSTHYSLNKLVHLINTDYLEIPSQNNGEMNYETLEAELKKNINRPAVIILNLGTTMTGAVDNLATVKSILKKLNKKDVHLHGDAALSGMILPFLDEPPPHNFDDGIHSISISGHKFIGSPIPCGIVITNQNFPQAYCPKISYVNVTDNTISGSRNGITPLFLWYAIQRNGYDGFKDLVDYCISLSIEAVQMFKKQGIDAWRNPHSNTIVFPKPSEEKIKKWQLAPHNDIVHILIMPHTTKAFISELLEDIRTEYV